MAASCNYCRFQPFKALPICPQKHWSHFTFPPVLREFQFLRIFCNTCHYQSSLLQPTYCIGSDSSSWFCFAFPWWLMRWCWASFHVLSWLFVHLLWRNIYSDPLPTFFFFNFRERAWVGERGRGRERERIPIRLHTQHGARCTVPSRDPGIMTRAKIKSRTFNRLSHPGTPLCPLLYWVICLFTIDLIELFVQPRYKPLIRYMIHKHSYEIENLGERLLWITYFIQCQRESQHSGAHLEEKAREPGALKGIRKKRLFWDAP